MAGGSLLMLLDDIASVLDDVSAMTKIAAKKTAGVLGDDLALNAQQVSGVRADRELVVVWAVAKGSLINKAILVPAALVISIFMPKLITPLLMIGGAYLCFEGFEKVAHNIVRRHHKPNERVDEQEEKSAASATTSEREKIRGAIRTDFILSAEIIVISLGAVAGAIWQTQIGVLVAVALLMTVGVYGLVAGIVKLDDIGLYLSRKTSKISNRIGMGILSVAPYLMKTLSVVGTLAMFLVGGGMIVHGIAPLAEVSDMLTQYLSGNLLKTLAAALWSALVGAVLGGAVIALVESGRWMIRRFD
ncbi:MAG: DUF808 domain-containing protein [Burkholderiales bacterium]|jgi:predicted DNA repair protein MutK|nr:DUF808 domain-containing protein [Burkholderiales bacterium]